MAQRRREYTREFKLEAVRLSQESEKSVADVARDLGIDVKRLYRWRSRYLAKGEQAFPGLGRRSADEEEVHRLRRELAMAQQERDILKKVTHERGRAHHP